MSKHTGDQEPTSQTTSESPHGSARDASWLQLPTVELYTAPEPLISQSAEPVLMPVDPDPMEPDPIVVEQAEEPPELPLAPRPHESGHVPAVRLSRDTSEPASITFIRGSGVSMGQPFLKRRVRPLSLRLTFYIVVACVTISGIFAASALNGSNPASSMQSHFDTIAGSISLTSNVSYHLYVAQPGDTIDGVATKFHVQIGGIYELNHMIAGQELQLGQTYKIPDNPFYGADYQLAPPIPQSNGSTTFGTDWWNSYAGTPLPGAFCSPSGPKPTDYQMVAPNPGARWVRGYTWYHLGIDLAAPYGNTIVAAQRGMAIWAGWTNLGYGWSVVINHCNHVSTLYGHMAKVLVKAGQNVEAGQPIGLEGSTGWSTGPHLHFSLFWNNQYVDPLPYYGGIIANILRPCNCYSSK
jgi:LysM repeat protein